MTRSSFQFDGGPPPSLDILGLEVGLAPFGWTFGLILLPFALGFLARNNLAWALLVFVALLLALSSQQALLIHVGGLAPTKIPFPWDFLGRWVLASLPALVVGYLAACLYAKRRAHRND